jgi:hypothetical protein
MQTRTLNYADMPNAEGVVVRASTTSVESALDNYMQANANPDFTGIILSTPVQSAHCVLARELADSCLHTHAHIHRQWQHQLAVGNLWVVLLPQQDDGGLRQGQGRGRLPLLHPERCRSLAHRLEVRAALRDKV